MSIRINLLVLIALIAFVAVATFLGTYYRLDRTDLIERACELGLPNPTLPHDFAESDYADRFDCPVFGERKRYFGYVTDVGGSLRFRGDEISAKDNERQSTRIDAILLCEDDDCGGSLARKLAENVVETCHPEIPRLQFAGAIIEGTVSSNSFQIGRSSLERDPIFYVSRVEEAFAPLAGEVEGWAERAAELGLCDANGE